MGHSQFTTTEIYTRADPSEKLEAIDAIVPQHLRRGLFRPTDKLGKDYELSVYSKDDFVWDKADLLVPGRATPAPLP